MKPARHSIEKTLSNKYYALARDVPKDFESLRNLKLDVLKNEVARLEMKERLLITRFGTLMGQVEALKNLTILSPTLGAEEKSSLKDGLFYNDMIPLLLFHEFWKNLNVGSGGQLSAISSLLSSTRFNKIRNAIAHADIEFEGRQTRMNDRGKVVEMNTLQLSSLASCLSVLAPILHESRRQFPFNLL